MMVEMTAEDDKIRELCLDECSVLCDTSWPCEHVTPCILKGGRRVEPGGEGQHAVCFCAWLGSYAERCTAYEVPPVEDEYDSDDDELIPSGVWIDQLYLGCPGPSTEPQQESGDESGGESRGELVPLSEAGSGG